MVSLTCGINDIFTDNMFQDLMIMEQSSFFWGAPFNLIKNMVKSILQVITKFKNIFKPRIKFYNKNDDIWIEGIVKDVRLERDGEIRPDGTYKQVWVADVEVAPSIFTRFKNFIKNLIFFIYISYIILLGYKDCYTIQLRHW